MNNPATIAVSEQNNDLSNFNRLIIFSLLFIGTVVSLFFLFEKEIVTYAAPRFPVTYGKSMEYYYDLFRLGAYELLWMGGILIVAWMLYNNPSIEKQFSSFEDIFLRRQSSFKISISITIFLFIILVASVALEKFPNSADEYVYLYQAETMSNGKLWEKAHPIETAFSYNHIAVKDGISVGRFPIGWPLIITAFLQVHIPAWLVNPILAFLTLLLFYKLGKKLYGARVACWSLITLVFSGFFIFNSASFFSHTSCLLASLGFVFCTYKYLDKDKVKYALLAGFAIGVVFLVRYYTAVLLFIPFGILLFRKYGFKIFPLFIWMGVGALPCGLALLWYNYEVTGNILTPVTVWGYRNEGLGFVNGHTVLSGLEHIIRRFFMFFYWCSPVLLVVYFVMLWKKISSKTDRWIVAEDYFFLSLIAGYFFYYEIGGNQYGPRFYYEAFPFMVLFVVNKIFQSQIQIAKVFLYAAIVIMIIKLPFIADRENEIVQARKDVYHLVDNYELSNAVVLLSSGTSVNRPMPAGDLTRNDINFTNDVLYAIDNQKHNGALMNYYPNRSFYRYVRREGKDRGELIRIR